MSEPNEEGATGWRAEPLAVVDVETTGLEPESDRVIEVAIVHMRAGEVEERWGSLVNPECELPPDVTQLTGIQPEDLETAPRFADLATEVRQRLEGRIFVAYNLGFDRGFLEHELRRAGHEWAPETSIDPLVFARELHRNKGSKRLEAVAERLGIEIGTAHRATDDAEAAGHVLYALGRELPDELEQLLVLQRQWAQQQENEMARWRKGGGEAAPGKGAGTDALGGEEERGSALGPAYLYGDETDPVRAMFTHLPAAGSRR